MTATSEHHHNRRLYLSYSNLNRPLQQHTHLAVFLTAYFIIKLVFQSFSELSGETSEAITYDILI